MVNGACLPYARHVYMPELTHSSWPLWEADARITTASQERKLRPMIHSLSLTRLSVIQTQSGPTGPSLDTVHCTRDCGMVATINRVSMNDSAKCPAGRGHPDQTGAGAALPRLAH